MSMFDARAELLNQPEPPGSDGFGVKFRPEWNDDVDRLIAGTLGKRVRRAPLHVNLGL